MQYKSHLFCQSQV